MHYAGIMPDGSSTGEQDGPSFKEKLGAAAVVEGLSGAAAVAATVAVEVGTRLHAALNPDVFRVLSDNMSLQNFVMNSGVSLDILYLQREPLAAAAVFGLTALVVGMGLHISLHNPDIPLS